MSIDRDGLRIAAAYYSGGDYTRNAGISWDVVIDLLDALGQAEARIDAVDAELLYAELHGNDEVWTHNIRRALGGDE